MPRTATVTTTSDARVLVLTDRAFAKLIRDVPSIAYKVLRSVGDRLAADQGLEGLAASAQVGASRAGPPLREVGYAGEGRDRRFAVMATIAAPIASAAAPTRPASQMPMPSVPVPTVPLPGAISTGL